MDAHVFPKDESPIELDLDFGGGIGGPGKGLGDSEESDKPVETFVIKEEEQDFDIDGGGVASVFGGASFGGGGSPCSSTKSTFGFSVGPKPLAGLYENGPPPFLTKTLEMVEDPETDPIVSWSDASNSFVVWDPHKFSVNVLPKYFKHSNFSSFIRQLNTYGFRKIHLDRWEFANFGFQRGKKHLLKTIKRRSYSCNNNNKRLMRKTTEIEKLKEEHETLKVEILNLRHQQENNDRHVALMEERVLSAEWKQRQMLMLIAKAMKRGSLIEQLGNKYERRKALGIGTAPKKHRLVSKDIPESPYPSMGMNYIVTDNMEELAKIESEMNSLLCSTTDGHDSSPVPESNLTSETSSPDLCSSNYIMWEKLMEDDVICENEPEFMPCGSHSKIVNELEDLITRPVVWGGCNREMVGEVGCLGSLA